MFKRHTFFTGKDIRHNILMREHNPFRLTGGTRSVDQGQRVVRLDPRGALPEELGVVRVIARIDQFVQGNDTPGLTSLDLDQVSKLGAL